ncbi:MAG: radical SAM protein [Anaerolineales bacterium]|nr:radical SAM protein [Anaerolineales bacterium]
MNALPHKALTYTESLCPQCLKVIDAQIIVQDGAVYMKKTCPDHGPFTVYVWPDADHYNWARSFRVPFRAPKLARDFADCCPTSCGLCSLHQRHSTLIELEVTQRCNLRCPVCFMAAEASPPDPPLAQLETIYANILEKAGEQTSIQLTGGEPTMRKDLPEIVRAGRMIGFSAIEINTNGLVISRNPRFLDKLVEAGISGIYLQFDGLTADVYTQIRGEDLLADKLQAIENCRDVGIQVVLAMTIIQGVNEDQIGAVLNFALENLDVVAGVALQPAFTSGRFDVQNTRRLTMGDVVFMLAEQTDGLIQPYEMWPLGCSHPLCSCGTQLVKEGDHFVPATRQITRSEYLEAFDAHSPQGSIFADILARKNGTIAPGLSVVVMNYMDAVSMDMARLKECSMTVAMDDDRLIPFCAYQVTNVDGKRLYPAWIKPEAVFLEG